MDYEINKYNPGILYKVRQVVY